MAGFFVLLITFAYYLWFVFLSIGGILVFFGRKWLLITSSLFGKIGSIGLLVIGIPFIVSGLYGIYMRISGAY